MNGIVSGSGTSCDPHIIEDWYNIEIKKGVQITKSGFDFIKIPVRRQFIKEKQATVHSSDTPQPL